MEIIIANKIGQHMFGGSGGATFDSDWQAVLDQATFLDYSLPTEAESIRASNAIIEAKAQGVWTKWDIFYGMIANIDFATLNWKDPTAFQLQLVNSPTYDPATGFQGNGTTSYINTQWIPNDSGIFLQNSAGMGYGCGTDGQQPAADVGASDDSNVSGILFNSRNTSNNFSLRFNSTAAGATANANGIGRYHVRRNGSTTAPLYKDGSFVVTISITSTGRTSRPIAICAYNFDGVITNFSSRKIKYLWAGESLSGSESTVDTIIQSIYA